MVRVGRVGVRMKDRLVHMPVAVGADRRRFVPMAMVAVVMNMGMFVVQCFVFVPVLMALQ